MLNIIGSLRDKGSRTLVCVLAALIFGTVAPVTGQPFGIPTPAGSVVVNGVYDGAEANAAGELSLTVNGVYFGESSLDATDSIEVDSVYAFGPLDTTRLIRKKAVSTTADTIWASTYDTIDVRYTIENYGNIAFDSFHVVAHLIDTSLIPSSFQILAGDSSAIGQVFSKDSVRTGFLLGPESDSTIFFRVIFPGPDTAHNLDSIKLAVKVLDRNGVGNDDTWPIGRIVLDTGGVYGYSKLDTLLDFGDTQYDTVLMRCVRPDVKIRKDANLLSATSLPGDTIEYSIWYDNDGYAASTDTAWIVDYLPYGVVFDTLTACVIDTGSGGRTIVDQYLYGSDWLDSLPYGAARSSTASRDTILRIKAVRFGVPEGIGSQYSGNGNDNTTNPNANESLDTDAGYIKYKVRIR